MSQITTLTITSKQEFVSLRNTLSCARLSFEKAIRYLTEERAPNTEWANRIYEDLNFVTELQFLMDKEAKKWE